MAAVTNLGECIQAVIPLLHSDPFAAIERIHRDAALDIAARYQALLAHSYWKAHDLPAVITLGNAGILYCLAQSLAPDTTPDLAEKLRSTAKALAYDVGSFTWPGWEEPGIHPTPADLAFGRQCAALNLRLALELKKPPEKLAAAHWLIGAHALAVGDPNTAEEHFALAQSVLPPTNATASLTPLYAGFLALTRLAKNPADATAKATFDAIVHQLATHPAPDAATYKSQLLAAHRLFIAP